MTKIEEAFKPCVKGDSILSEVQFRRGQKDIVSSGCDARIGLDFTFAGELTDLLIKVVIGRHRKM